MRSPRLHSSLVLCSLPALLVSAAASATPNNTSADAVLGQLLPSTKEANQGGVVGAANTMNGNRNITIDPVTGRLWVADTSNNRVLGFDSPATFTNGQNANVVLGQADFAGIQPNLGAVNPSEFSMTGPRSVAVDPQGRLYVADSSNFRILRFDPPFTNGEAAVQVFGQPNFTTAVQNNGGTSATSLSNPDGIACDSQGNVYLADRNISRILIFNTPATTDTTADVVLGQVNFTTSGGNNPGAVPTDSNLSMVISCFVDANTNLYACDEGNNRVLLYTPPFTNGKAAVKVFGQLDFSTGNSNQGGISASSLFGPVGAAVDPITGNLFIADPINSRILEYNDPINGDRVADRVFGQLESFTTGTVNKGGVSADSLNDVGGVAVDSLGNLYGSDRLNSRLLRYDAAPIDTNTNGTMDMNTNGTADDTNTNNTMDSNTNGTPDNGDDGGMSGITCGIFGICGAGLAGMAPVLLIGWAAMRRRFRAGRFSRRPSR